MDRGDAAEMGPDFVYVEVKNDRDQGWTGMYMNDHTGHSELVSRAEGNLRLSTRGICASRGALIVESGDGYLVQLIEIKSARSTC